MLQLSVSFYNFICHSHLKSIITSEEEIVSDHPSRICPNVFLSLYFVLRVLSNLVCDWVTSLAQIEITF